MSLDNTSKKALITDPDTGLQAEVFARSDGKNALAVDLLSPGFLTQVALGNVPGYSIVRQFGRNPDIDAGSGFEAIWNGGSVYTGQNATAAEKIKISSSSSADAAAGTGARTVYISGLNASYNEISETITMTGTVPVETTNSYIRFTKAQTMTGGSAGGNVGEITGRQTTTIANVFFIMPIGFNETSIGAYTVPAGKTGLVFNWFITLSGHNSNVNVISRGKVRPFGTDTVFQVKEEMAVHGTGTSTVDKNFSLPNGPFPTKADLVLEAESDSNNTSVAAGFAILLIDD